MPTGHHFPQPEVRGDQRRVGLDVRAHHQNVARLQGLVVGEQAQQYLAQHVDLPGRAVTAVHLHGPVASGQNATVRTYRVGGDVGLQPAQQRIRMICAGKGFIACRSGRHAALQLSQVAAEGGQQWVPDAAMALVVASGHDPAQIGQRRPRLRARVRQPQVQFVMGAQRLQQFDIGGRQPGVAEQRQPRGQLAGRLAELGNRFGVPNVRRVDPHHVDEPVPQLRLPSQIAGKVSGVAGKPVGQQSGALAGVGGEQSGQATGHRVAAALPQFLFLISDEPTEMDRQRVAPRLVQVGIDHFQKGPGHGIR